MVGQVANLPEDGTASWQLAPQSGLLRIKRQRHAAGGALLEDFDPFVLLAGSLESPIGLQCNRGAERPELQRKLALQTLIFVLKRLRDQFRLGTACSFQ